MDNREDFNDSLFLFQGNRLKAIYYEKSDVHARGASGLQFEYVSTSIPGTTVITPLRCSHGGQYAQTREKAELAEDEYIVEVIKKCYSYTDEIWIQVVFKTNKSRRICVGYGDEVYTESRWRAAAGKELFVFCGTNNETELLDFGVAAEKKTDEYCFNHMPAVQGNGDLKKIHVYTDFDYSRIYGVAFKYNDRPRHKSRNPVAGDDCGHLFRAIDLTRWFRSDDYVQEIDLQYFTQENETYIDMIKIITNRTSHMVGKKHNDVNHRITKLKAEPGMQIYALQGACAKKSKHLTYLDVSMYKPVLQYDDFEDIDLVTYQNEFIKAYESDYYSQAEMKAMYNATIQKADERSKEQLQEEGMKTHILNYKLPKELLTKKQFVFRGMIEREVELITRKNSPERRTYSRAEYMFKMNPGGGKKKPEITLSNQNSTQRESAAILRTAAASRSHNPPSQFTSNAFDLEYLASYAKGDVGLVYAYELVPNSELLGVESGEYQCQVVGKTPIDSFYRFEMVGKKTWEKFDFVKKNWDTAKEIPYNDEYQQFRQYLRSEAGQSSKRDNDEEDEHDENSIFAMRFNLENVRDCQREPIYPQVGQKFTAWSLKRPSSFAGMTEEQMVHCHLRLSEEKDGSIGLYLFRNSVEGAESPLIKRIGTGKIYGLDEKGFLYVQNRMYGYFFVRQADPCNRSEISYFPTVGQASMEDIRMYRF